MGEQTNLAIYPLKEKVRTNRENIYQRYRIPRCKRTYFTIHQQIQPRLLTMVNNWKLAFGDGTYRCISRFVSPFILLFLVFLPFFRTVPYSPVFFSVPKHRIYGKRHGPFNREAVEFLVLDKQKPVELSTRRVSFNERNGETICNSARFRLTRFSNSLSFFLFIFFFPPETRKRRDKFETILLGLFPPGINKSALDFSSLHATSFARAIKRRDRALRIDQILTRRV